MNVLVRLVLLAGAAAAISLMVREPLARRVAAAITPGVTALAHESRRLTPRSPAMLPMLPAAPTAILPLLPPAAAHTPIVPVPLKKPAKPAASANVSTISRKQLEDAIATRLEGARATLVRDEAGQPLGLRLTGVGRLAPYGVHEGDVLVSANALSLRTPDEALAALGKLQDAKHVVVVLRRGTATYSVPIDLVE